ncbi:hypothetical protein [Actinoplanes sp. L3-i22]|uniref:hypothetical protein n=1 Tax=Actinoplanes sp. L3-i22 TaxID=2836373 RepID=UPI001C794093|nr:hypothetical protein [Actinoplanes sp. L3-i22]BCY08182.1 hypothetical protein L3i22_032700 [Actinoplanes sp. L3-i22]
MTMRELKRLEMERLWESTRRLRISLLVTLAAVVVLLVLLIVGDVGLPVFFGAPIGVGIGLLLTIPNRKVVAELGLTPAEARVIVEAERLRRNGVADLPPEARAGRETVRGRIWLAVALVSTVILVVAAKYFFGKAGQTVEEDAPTDIWFGVSFFAGFAALVLAPTAFWQAGNHREAARSWQRRAGA